MGEDASNTSKKSRSNLVDVGRITTVFGVKGWVKIISDTQPMENIFSYGALWLKTKHGVKAMEVDEYRPHGKGLVAHIKGLDDRDEAQALSRTTIAVERSQMPVLDTGDYYWHQLEGLTVVTEYDGQSSVLGRVAELMETGANDVLVVKADANSIDDTDRLIPYVPEQYVIGVDLAAGQITVDWDPEF